MIPTEAATAATDALAAAEQRVEACRAAVTSAEEEAAHCHTAEQTAGETARQIEPGLTRLETEAEALSVLLAPTPALGTDQPIVSTLQVAAGFETAIGAIFEDELTAPIADGEGPTGSSFWGGLPP